MARTQACWFNDSTDCNVNDYITQPLSLLISCWKYLSPKDFLSLTWTSSFIAILMYSSHCVVLPASGLSPPPSWHLSILLHVPHASSESVLRDQRLQTPVLCALVWAPHLHKPHSYSFHRASFPNTTEEWPAGAKWTGIASCKLGSHVCSPSPNVRSNDRTLAPRSKEQGKLILIQSLKCAVLWHSYSFYGK